MDIDPRLKPANNEQAAPLEAVVVEERSPASQQQSTSGNSDGGENPAQQHLAPPTGQNRGHPQREISDETKIGSSDAIGAESGAGKSKSSISPLLSPTDRNPQPSAGGGESDAQA